MTFLENYCGRQAYRYQDDFKSFVIKIRGYRQMDRHGGIQRQMARRSH
jgi:hypothetical protein